MHKSKVVNTKRERRSSNNKKQQASSVDSQSIGTLGALVTTGLPSMSDENNTAEILVIKPTSIEINSQPNGNHHHPSPTKSPRHDSTISHLEQSVDSGLSSEITNTEGEKYHSVTDEVSSIKHQRQSSPTSGVIIPEEKRVTDRVKVFEAVANHNDKAMTKNGNNNTNKKKSSISASFSIGDQKQISPPPSTTSESLETQSINEMKSSKNKSKKSSLKKQIQNLLKIDKPSNQDEFLSSIDDGKKNKKDLNQNGTMSTLKSNNLVQPLEIEIPSTKTIDIESHIKTPSAQSEHPTLSSSSPSGVSQLDTSINNTSADILSSHSPRKSIPSIVTHSPMSSGAGDLMKTSTTRSVSIESGTRNRSPMQRYGTTEASNSSSYSILNQSSNAQVTDNLRVQHQREKQELSELNDRFRGYLDRVKVLETKNSKLTSQLDDISKTWGTTSQAIISQYSAPLDRLRQEVNESMIDEADLQTRLRRSHYDIDNYRSLIHDETVWNERQEGKREQLKLEYEHSCAELSALQKSFQQIDDQLKVLLKQREDYLQEIDQLNEQSYRATLERIKLDLQVQTLREEIPFLNDVHAHLISEFEQLKPTNGIDTQLFYRQELEKAIRDIRRDFETLHAAQRKEMEDYYTVKIEEIQNDAKKLVPSHSRQDDLTKMSEQIKSTKFELSDTQKLLINEKDKFKDLQERLAKLEEEYYYIRNQGSDTNDNVNKEFYASQERIQQLTEQIDTILRSNITLESEINIYRRLLDSETNRLAQKPVEPVLSPEPAPPSFGSELGKVFNKKIKKGPIAIKDCAPDGKCITLENSSNDKDVDVSNWTLKRRVEGSSEISYTIPFGLTMKHGSELKIFARSAQNAHHRPPLQVVNDKLDSWGMGTECETKLFNEQGEEKASHSQKIVFGSESTRSLP